MLRNIFKDTGPVSRLLQGVACDLYAVAASLLEFSRHSPLIEALEARAPQTVLFDVSFPEKLLKIVATRGEIFSLKFTKYRLAAGLRPDPLGELKRSPRPPSRNKGAYF